MLDNKLNRRSWMRYVTVIAGVAGLNKLGFASGLNFGQGKDDNEKDVLIERVFYKRYDEVKTIYENSLSSESDVTGFVLEGVADISFPNNRLRIENTLDPSLKQKANLVYWCPEDFPDNVAISWDFYPVKEPGLCILFFSAKGKNGEDIFSNSLNKRAGDYKQYHHGDINALHVSYFRRNKNIRDFQLCNLRKSYGHNMVIQGPDPIPCTEYAKPPYNIRVVKYGSVVEFYINDLQIFEWHDDGTKYGPILGGGKIGFRQMAPLIGEYSNLKVTALEKK